MRATMGAANLRDAIRAVMPAMSKDDCRPSLNCVHLGFKSSGSQATATDGHWMAVHEIDCSVHEPGGAGIEPAFLKKLLVVLADCEGLVGIAMARDKIQFNIEGVRALATKAITCCPPYEKVWPSGKPAKMPFMGLEAGLLARVMNAFRAGDRQMPMRFEFYGELDPVLVTSPSHKLKCLVMPCRL